jgi:hypothetical protein
MIVDGSRPACSRSVTGWSGRACGRCRAAEDLDVLEGEPGPAARGGVDVVDGEVVGRVAGGATWLPADRFAGEPLPFGAVPRALVVPRWRALARACCSARSVSLSCGCRSRGRASEPSDERDGFRLVGVAVERHRERDDRVDRRRAVWPFQAPSPS